MASAQLQPGVSAYAHNVNKHLKFLLKLFTLPSIQRQQTQKCQVMLTWYNQAKPFGLASFHGPYN